MHRYMEMPGLAPLLKNVKKNLRGLVAFGSNEFTEPKMSFSISSLYITLMTKLEF